MTHSSKQKWALIALVYAGLTVRSAAQSTTAPTLDARASDPVAMGWMVGVAAAARQADSICRRQLVPSSRRRAGRSRNIRQLMPTSVVASRRRDRSCTLPRAERDGSRRRHVPADRADARTMTWAQSLAANYTDGILVLHRGRIVYERYFGALDADTPAHRVLGDQVVRRDRRRRRSIAEGTLDETRDGRELSCPSWQRAVSAMRRSASSST